MKTLCVTGHRPDSLPFMDNISDKRFKAFKKELNKNILFAIDNGYTHFISGGALGIDTIFALEIIKLKQKGKPITLEIAVPCGSQDSGWSDEDKRVYNKILSFADEVNILSAKYYPFCMQKRNEYMVNKSDCVLCCWTGKRKGGTYSTIKLAEKNKKQLLLIDLSDEPTNGGNKMIIFKDKITKDIKPPKKEKEK